MPTAFAIARSKRNSMLEERVVDRSGSDSCETQATVDGTAIICHLDFLGAGRVRVLRDVGGEQVCVAEVSIGPTSTEVSEVVISIDSRVTVVPGR